MLKKALPILISLSLLFGLNAAAQNFDSQNRGTFDFPQERQNFSRDSSDNTEKMPQEFPTEDSNAEIPTSEENKQFPSSYPNTQSVPTEGSTGRFNMPDMSQFAGQMPEGMGANNMGAFPGGMGGFSFGTQNTNQTMQPEQSGFMYFINTYSTPIISVILLFFAFIFVIFYKRKKF